MFENCFQRFGFVDGDVDLNSLIFVSCISLYTPREIQCVANCFGTQKDAIGNFSNWGWRYDD